MHDVLYLFGSFLVTFSKDSVHREKCKQVYNLMNFHKLNNLCNQHPDQERECYQYPESPSCRLLSLPPQGPPLSWLSVPRSSSACLWTWYMCRVIQHVLLLASFAQCSWNSSTLCAELQCSHARCWVLIHMGMYSDLHPFYCGQDNLFDFYLPLWGISLTYLLALVFSPGFPISYCQSFDSFFFIFIKWNIFSVWAHSKLFFSLCEGCSISVLSFLYGCCPLGLPCESLDSPYSQLPLYLLGFKCNGSPSPVRLRICVACHSISCCF